MAEYYSQRSSRKGTFVISEGTFITLGSGGHDSGPGIFNSDQIEAWKQVVEAVHKNESFFFMQLWHTGRQSFPNYLKDNNCPFVSATDDLYLNEETKQLALAVGNPQHGLTKEEIAQYIADYVQAAKNALEVGCDGVEIHSANGYLLNQFLDPISNNRTDEYGGSIENRARFVLELIDALVEAIDAEKVGIRFSPFGVYGNMSGISEPLIVSQFAYIFGELEKRAIAGKRIAYIHLVEPRATDFNLTEGEGCVDASNDFIYSIWNGCVIRAGNYAMNPECAKADSAKKNTAIAYGRFFISNPDLPDRLARGLPLNDYDRDLFYTPGSKGYTDYPTYEDAVKHSDNQNLISANGIGNSLNKGLKELTVG